MALNHLAYNIETKARGQIHILKERKRAGKRKKERERRTKRESEKQKLKHRGNTDIYREINN